MKNAFKVLGIIALVALIGFSFSACDILGGGGGGDKTVSSIEVTTKPTKTSYNIGDTFDKTGMVVTAKYNDGTEEAVTGYSTSGFSSTTEGEKTITVTYKEKTADFKVTVGAKQAVGKPSANPAGGTLVAKGTLITLTTATTEADIYYTTNGNNPTKSSTKFTTPFAITPPTTVNAIAFKDGLTDSEMLTAEYPLTPITVADISIRGPVKDNTPPSMIYISDTGRFQSDVMVTWSPHHNKFLGDTVYSATITLRANDGYTFAGLTADNAKVNGDKATIQGTPGSMLTLEYTFPKTDTRTVTNITIKSQPNKMTYNSYDPLDLTGLVVTLTYEDNSTVDVSPAKFIEKSISAYPSHGNQLSKYNDGKSVRIMYGGIEKSTSSTLKVNPVNISGVDIAPIPPQTYNAGAQITPRLDVFYIPSSVLFELYLASEWEGVLYGDYTATWTNNVNKGTAKVTITGRDNFTGTKEQSFTIDAKSVADADVYVRPIESVLYTGSAITPTVIVEYNGNTLTKDTDYTVAYSNNTNKGEATVTISGKGNYTGTKQAKFTISDKLNPTVTTWPTAAAITYGQALSDSTLSGGVSTPPGTFTWENSATVPTATGPQNVKFTPGNTTEYNTVTGTATVTVGKATPTITTLPTASNTTVGAALSTSNLTGGSAKNPYTDSPITGSFRWTNPTATVSATAGNHEYSVTFTPTDTTNYNTATGNVSVNVGKGNPNITTWPTAPNITYGQELSDSILNLVAHTVPGSFAWEDDSTSRPNAGNHSFRVKFTPEDEANYDTVTGSVNIIVDKATPTIATLPTASSTTVGAALSTSNLSGGSAKNPYTDLSVAGSFAWTTPTATVSTIAGDFSYSVTFTPTGADATNYNSATGNVSVEVEEE